jgi:hypothetical protein
MTLLAKAGQPATLDCAFPAKAEKPEGAAPEKAEGKGKLDLWGEPFTTKFLVDGKQVGGGTAHIEVELSAGRHSIDFVIEDPSLTKTVNRKVDVKAGGNETVKINFVSDT